MRIHEDPWGSVWVCVGLCGCMWMYVGQRYSLMHGSVGIMRTAIVTALPGSAVDAAATRVGLNRKVKQLGMCSQLAQRDESISHHPSWCASDLAFWDKHHCFITHPLLRVHDRIHYCRSLWNEIFPPTERHSPVHLCANPHSKSAFFSFSDSNVKFLI